MRCAPNFSTTPERRRREIRMGKRTKTIIHRAHESDRGIATRGNSRSHQGNDCRNRRFESGPRGTLLNKHSGGERPVSFVPCAPSEALRRYSTGAARKKSWRSCLRLKDGASPCTDVGFDCERTTTRRAGGILGIIWNEPGSDEDRAWGREATAF